MHPSSRRAGYVGELCTSVLGKHLSQRRVFRGLDDARWLVEHAVHRATRALGRESL